MKTLSLCMLVVVSFITGSHEQSTAVDYDLTKKVEIAEIKNGTIEISIDKERFIAAINKSMLVDESPVHTLEVLKGTAIGNEEKEFYYLALASKHKNFNLVRALYNRNGKLVMDKADLKSNYLTYSYFVSCEGVDGCQPTMFYEDEEFWWSCSDKKACLTKEEAKRNPCTKATSIID